MNLNSNANASGAEKCISWSSLIDYYLSCLKHEDSFEGFLQRSDTRSRYVFPVGREEKVFSDGNSGLRVDPKVETLVEAARLRGETLFYGYPVVLVEDKTGGTTRRKLGCLMAIELGVPKSGDPIPKALFPKFEEPFFHSAVLSKFGVKSEQQSLLLKALPPAHAMGSPEALGAYILELMTALDLATVGTLDPQRLDVPGEGEIDRVGVHNTAIVFRGASSDYNRRLLSELQQLRAHGTEAAKTAAGRLLPVSDVQIGAQDKPVPFVVSPISANDAQLAALEAGLCEPLTVVTGPPGTGKSQLVANLIASAWASNQSVLVVSTNNQAVDVACARAQDIHPGMVIRTGSREHRERAKETLHSLLSSSTALVDKRAIFAGLKAARQRLASSRTALDIRTRSETRLAEVLLGQESLKSGAKMAASNLLGLIDRPQSAARWLRKVRRVRAAKWLRTWRLRRISEKLNLDICEYGDVAEEYLQLDVERLALQDIIHGCSQAGPLVREVVEADDEFRKRSVEFIGWRVSTALLNGKVAIRAFLQARVAGPHNGVAAAFPSVIPHIRAWASTALSVGATMPLTAGLFDIVVIDEASQCGIAQILPVLFRAKRAIIIGDAQQLSHISGIGPNDERNRIESAGLDEAVLVACKLSHRRHSIFDLMAARAGKDHTFLLDEHYRSHPQIIDISNQLFYGGNLTILTDPARLIDFGKNAVAWKNVSGVARRPTSGSAENPKEAAEVAEAVLELTKRHSMASIGVVTPFSAQARLIQDLLESRISAEARLRSSLTVGTAHRFQGDERDVIVFSSVASDGLDARTLGWLGGTPNLFNVAITRAQSYLLVVGNWHFCSEASGPLAELARYVRTLDIERTIEKSGQLGRLHSQAESRLYAAMLNAGLIAEPKVLIRGYECDFVIRHADTVINIECDGRHHLDASGRLRLQDHARDAMIEHQGWRVLRIPAWRCLGDSAGAVSEIRSFLSGVQSRANATRSNSLGN